MEEQKKKFKFWKWVGGGICNIINSLFYDAEGFFSTRKLMNLTFFGLAVGLVLVGVYVKVKYKISLPGELYAFVGSLCGGGFLQYAYKDTLITKRNNGSGPLKKIPKQPPVQDTGTPPVGAT